eukprot:TRINITY_DN29108_c0_g1_i1.p1 TRINITY_DN29108_c0_g1~~TRINITY_DN29108_c0_g1_i1.p1  ORF type:complete len:413 (-),score=86.22 TRINITY_DN29108_c0_g1_i1:29-1204(-)
MLLNWNVNYASAKAFKLIEQPGLELLHGDAQHEVGVVPQDAKSLYFFHMMYSHDLGEALEILGCSDIAKVLDPHRFFSVSSNLYFAPLLRTNPHVPKDTVSGFPQLLKEMFAPSDAAAERAISVAKNTSWGEKRPVIAIHIRARVPGEDNDDWPTAAAPDAEVLKALRRCTERAIALELPGATEWDVYIASSTKKARTAVAKELKASAEGLKNVLRLPKVELNRKSSDGAIDSMAEALLISRADIFVRLVVGTSGFSTFAYLSNALRIQNDWTAGMPALERSKPMPNYVVTDACAADQRCFTETKPEVRMARIAWHGEEFTKRSCGDPVKRITEAGQGERGCGDMQAIDLQEEKPSVAEELPTGKKASKEDSGSMLGLDWLWGTKSGGSEL